MGVPFEPEIRSSAGTGAGQPAAERSSEGVASLLAVARQNINEGNPSLALQAVDRVRRTSRGKSSDAGATSSTHFTCGASNQPASSSETVMMALHATGGEQAVFEAMNRARETYQNGPGASVGTDELSALFAEFAIGTLPPSLVQTPEPVEVEAEEMDGIEPNEDSILAESGRQQVVVDASSDGSSFVCEQCGGVVSNVRKDEHLTYWCSPPLLN